MQGGQPEVVRLTGLCMLSSKMSVQGQTLGSAVQVPAAARRQRQGAAYEGVPQSLTEQSAACMGRLRAHKLRQIPMLLSVERAMWAQSLAAEAERMHGDRSVLVTQPLSLAAA